MSMDFYARNGDPITLEQWTELIGNLEYKRVGYTTLGEAWVSTVWLGVNHSWIGEGPPIIFETMVFGGELDQQQWRYTTEAQALDGHANVVEMVRLAHQLEMPDALVERPVREEQE